MGTDRNRHHCILPSWLDPFASLSYNKNFPLLSQWILAARNSDTGRTGGKFFPKDPKSTVEKCYICVGLVTFLFKRKIRYGTSHSPEALFCYNMTSLLTVVAR